MLMGLEKTLNERSPVFPSHFDQFLDQLEDRFKHLMMLYFLRFIVADRGPEVFHLGVSFQDELLEVLEGHATFVGITLGL